MIAGYCATPEQTERIKQLLTKLNLWALKEGMVSEFSIESRTRIGDLMEDEATRMITHLESEITKSDKMRKRALSIGYQLHWDKPRTPAEHMMDSKRLNYNHVSNWLEKDIRSKVKKPLHRLNPFELVSAVQQLEQVLSTTKEELKRNYAKQ
jgi:hypothetical protein